MAQAATQTAPVASDPNLRPDDLARWKDVMGLPCTISVEIPLSAFKVRDLLTLERELVIGSAWPTTSNVPVRVNGEAVAWCEFEVIGSRLAIRLTELV
ncbi:MAG TPA: FliM/FliN family flagellar motor C-terminal domain-containing protein [Terracidiphilus sp.]|jgi:flagellar motor switch/type III secretory pathway protein FliN|nr:FliM/FliN family flagellar motor C-terminal domain-containing protein [Terracidiphilus sp.]